jgi:hypothetical protein
MPLAFTFPVGDWQFWAVSVCALAAVLFLCRGLIPGKKRKKQREKRVTLTIDRKQAEK